ncbi:RNA polymerase sigma factor [Salegentibacter salarius]|uniref:RNA polymerase subunit sigma n=1 Tax=Salegentibacter salarius TaxID=435906 RepID=A0A2N0TW36_9FLAO|nr:RNA polymerase sigma factor [Salegentibacter salarius]OEY72609.1 RNA polymerase subunit sigma [Salegentibacter salarius]PKD18868.1 RNA polymerase subunit sigma [Salegentibacter salarius]SLK01899.1 RNA polymerase sigma-70 factor, ECF subfamily [Salegentibacter salarius]
MTPTITHINDLVARCQKGDQRAQMEVYERYYRAMYNTSVRIVKDTAEAEDIMQEAFLKAFSKINTLQEVSTFGAWLKRIVVNLSINSFNHKVKLNEVTYNDELKNQADESKGIILENDSKDEKVKKILKTLNSLKENYRVALTLHLIEGYDYEEIGKVLNLSYANCRTTISRAKESLRKKLLKDETGMMPDT